MSKTSKYKRVFEYKFSHFGTDTYGHDVKAFGDTTGKYFFWDASADTLYVKGTLDLEGTFNSGNIALIDNETLTFGTGLDVVIKWDGTKLLIDAATDNSLIEIGDGTTSFDVKWYGNSSSGVDYLYADASRNLIELTNIEFSQRKRTEIFDDFVYQAIAETYTPWVLNSGSDAEAIDPAIDLQEGGVIKITTGDADGTVANDGSQLVCAIPVQADSGGLVFETKLHINTAITEISVNAGFTDSKTLEEPFTGASDVLTSVASDAACFLFDDGNTTKEWFAAAVDGDSDDTGNGATGSAPVSDTYQVLRIEVSSDGSTILFYVDGTLVKTLSTSNGVSPDVDLYATVVACSTTTTSKSVDVDYIYVGHNKAA